jgi:hypothetical protein
LAGQLSIDQKHGKTLCNKFFDNGLLQSDGSQNKTVNTDLQYVPHRRFKDLRIIVGTVKKSQKVKVDILSLENNLVL